MSKVTSSRLETKESSQVSQFLTFTIQGEEYGIEILRVQEIKGISQIRPIPNAPSYMKGVINLRGTVVPILDLRCRLGMTELDYSKYTVVIVVTVDTHVVGLVVDAVSDVVDIEDDQVDSSAMPGAEVDSSCLQGLGKVGDKLVLLLNVDRLFGDSALKVSHTAVA